MGLFDQSFVDEYNAFYNKYKDMPEDQFSKLFPMQPLSQDPSAVPGTSMTPPPDGAVPFTTPPVGPGGGISSGALPQFDLPPDQMPQPGPPPVPYDPNEPEIDANAAPKGIYDPEILTSSHTSEPTGGILSQLFGGGAGGVKPSGSSKPWGPMLMALGGGIAQGAAFGGGGWGGGLGKGFTNAAAVRQDQTQLDQQLAQRKELADQELAQRRAHDSLAYLASRRDAAARRSASKNKHSPQYLLAVDAGYTPGTPEFNDFMGKIAMKSGSTNVNITNGGDAPKLMNDGTALVRDPDPNSETGWKFVKIPGGKQEGLDDANDSRLQNSTEQKTAKAHTMMDAIKGIRDAQKSAYLPTTGTGSDIVANAYSETGAAAIRGHVATLKSGIALNAMTRLKEASKQGATGFGNMNEQELQLLLNDIGSLNPDGNTAVFNQTIDRIEKTQRRVIERSKASLETYKKSPNYDPQLGAQIQEDIDAIEESFGDGGGGDKSAGAASGDWGSDVDAEIKRRGL